jgi:O-antigen/teichoic acid export membrane protein
MLRRLSAHRALQLFQVLRLAALLFISVLLAKSGLPLGDIGLYEAMLWIGTTLTFFWLVALLQSVVVFYSPPDTLQKTAGVPQTSPSSDGPLVFHTFFLLCGASAVLWAILCAFPALLLETFTGQSAVPDFYYGFCTAFFIGIPAYLTEYIYLLRHQPRAILIWGILSFGGQVVFFYLPLQLGYGLVGAVTAGSGWSLLRFVWTLRLVLQYGPPVWSPALLTRQWQFARPLAGSLLVGQAILFFDNWLVQHWYQDAGIFAIYRYGARELPFATALTNALTASIIPAIQANRQKGLETLRRETTRLMHLLFPLTLALLLASPTLFPAVFNRDFAASVPVFNVYLLIVASRILLPGSILLSLGKSKVLLYSSLLELAIKIGTGFLFISWWGLTGVALSAVFSYWIEKVAQAAYLSQRAGIRPAQWLSVRLYFLYIALLLLAWAGIMLWNPGG